MQKVGLYRLLFILKKRVPVLRCAFDGFRARGLRYEFTEKALSHETNHPIDITIMYTLGSFPTLAHP